MSMYMVTARCNPYDARFHYHGETVLEHDMTTPIKWVIDCGYGDGLSKHEALSLLEHFAADVDYWSYYDDETIRDLITEMMEDEGVDNPDVDWYQGPGYYDDYNLQYLIGDECLRIDTLLYRIEEYQEPEA